MHFAIEPVTKPEGATVHYIIQTEGSTFTVRAFAAGLLSAFGHNPAISIPEFEGEIVSNSEALDDTNLKLVIQSAALAATGDISEKDRAEIDRKMHDEVLEADSFPEIVYQCSRVSASKTAEGEYWVALNGTLILHGVERSQPVSARVSMNGNSLRARGEFSILQSNYEIQPVSAVGGTIKLKDELKFSFDISARKQA